MNQAENEAFESWAKIMNMGGTNFGMLKIDGLYADTRTSLAWAAWVASAINSYPEIPDNSSDITDEMLESFFMVTPGWLPEKDDTRWRVTRLAIAAALAKASP